MIHMAASFMIAGSLSLALQGCGGGGAPPLKPAPTHAKSIKISTGAWMPLAFQGDSPCKPEGPYTDTVTDWAFEAGYFGIDTAAFDPSYNDSGVAIALKGRARDTYWITTKIPSASYYDPALTESMLDQALEHLGLDYVDLILTHDPGQYINKTSGVSLTVEETIQQQWAGFEKFYKKGKAKAIGVSNYCNRAMTSLLKTASVVPHVNQVIYHAGMGPDPSGVISFARKHNITIQCECSTDWFNPALSAEPYKSIGEKYNKSGVQVALRWLVQQGHAIITGSHHKKYQIENFDVFNFELTPDEMKTINGQTSCRAAHRYPPYCQLTNFPDSGGCCDMEGHGQMCENWGDGCYGPWGTELKDGTFSGKCISGGAGAYSVAV